MAHHYARHLRGMAGALALAVLAQPASADWQLRDANNTTLTFGTVDIGSVKHPKYVSVDGLGNPLFTVNNAGYVQGVVGIGGLLPGFAAPPTVNIGTLNGAATAAKQDGAQATLNGILTALQAQAAAAGAGAASTLTIANFPAIQPVSGTLTVGNFPAVQPISGAVSQASGPWGVSWSGQTVGVSGLLPAFATPPTVNLGAIANVATTIKQDAAQATLEGILTAIQAQGTGSAAAGGTVTVGNFPATQPVSGTVTVGNFPATQPISGSVAVGNFPATQPVSGTVAVGNFPTTQPVSGTVTVGNLPATQPVSGTVAVGNFPATQPVSGTVAVGNFPTNQPVSGTVTVGNLPATQAVSGTVSLGGTLPAFTAPPTFNLGTLNGAATEAGHLATIDTKTPALGQAARSASQPVTMANDPDTLLAAITLTAVDAATVSTAGQNAIAVMTGMPTAGSSIAQAINGQAMALVSVSSTWVGTLVTEVSGDAGKTWSTAGALQRGTSIVATSLTGNGQFQVDVSGQTNVRVRTTALTSGTPAVQINLAQGPGLVRLANPARLVDGTTGNQASIKPGSAAAATDNGMVVVDPTTAAAVAAAASQSHSDMLNYAVMTGTKGAPASAGVSLLSVPLPWVSSLQLEACKRFKVGAGIAYRIKVTLGTGSGTHPNGFLKLYDLAAIPADGADTPFLTDVVGSTGFGGIGDEDFNSTPTTFQYGLVACFSTTGGFVKTSQPTPTTFFSAQVQ